MSPHPLITQERTEKSTVTRLLEGSVVIGALAATLFFGKSYATSFQVEAINDSITTVQDVHRSQSVDYSGLTSPSSQHFKEQGEEIEYTKKQAQNEVVGALKFDLADKRLQEDTEQGGGALLLLGTMAIGIGSVFRGDSAARFWLRKDKAKDTGQ